MHQREPVNFRDIAIVIFIVFPCAHDGDIMENPCYSGGCLCGHIRFQAHGLPATHTAVPAILPPPLRRADALLGRISASGRRVERAGRHAGPIPFFTLFQPRLLPALRQHAGGDRRRADGGAGHRQLRSGQSAGVAPDLTCVRRCLPRMVAYRRHALIASQFPLKSIDCFVV